MVFACIEIPRILLIKGKLHWRAKNRIISAAAADSPSKLAAALEVIFNFQISRDHVSIRNSLAKTERSLFSTFQHNMYITYLDGTVVLYIQQEEHFHKLPCSFPAGKKKAYFSMVFQLSTYLSIYQAPG